MIISFWDKKKMFRSLFLISLLINAIVAQKPEIPNLTNLPKPELPNPTNLPIPELPKATNLPIPEGLNPTNLLKPAPRVPAQRWSTLSGNEPLVISRGGFSGLFPEGSREAIAQSLDISVFLCNLMLAKDGGAFCLTGVTLDNATTIEMLDPKVKTYKIEGKDVQGHFSLDYDGILIDQNVSMTQAIFSRPSFYDGLYPVLNVDGILSEKPDLRFWLNVQNPEFYTKHGLKAVDVVLDILKAYNIEFVSCADIGFLKSISGKTKKETKIIFKFLNLNHAEPETKQPYSSIMKDLATVKSFASGIMVPKDYIWPLKPDKYLGLPTTLVADAHKLGLEIYASGFANDFFGGYDYNYDPTSEYLQFIDKGESVDGVITDFPVTATNAIACFSHNITLPKKGPTLIITNNGASGVYPGSTDLAYQQAIDDGADIIDCSVQMTKDGIAFCSNSTDLTAYSTAMPKFMSRSSKIPELQAQNGIFSFDLTWSEIQTLKPQTITKGGLLRNPAKKNSGKFVTLQEFLEFAKTKAVPGVLINIPNANFLASKKGLDIVAAVTTALSNATLDKQTTQQVLIQSDDSSVLSKFKDIPSYKRVMLFNDRIGNVPKQTAEEIKKYADAVNLPKIDVIEVSRSLLVRVTNVVQELKAVNLTVFIHTLKNEYTTLAFDYWADPYIEIATYIQTAKVDGIVTEFPATANRFMRSPCSDPLADSTILPAQPGDLLGTIAPELLPPAEAPLPSLDVSKVVDPPLPAVTGSNKAEPAGAGNSGAGTSGAGAGATPAANSPPSSIARANLANSGLSLVAIMVLAMLYTRH